MLAVPAAVSHCPLCGLGEAPIALLLGGEFFLCFTGDSGNGGFSFGASVKQHPKTYSCHFWGHFVYVLAVRMGRSICGAMRRQPLMTRFICYESPRNPEARSACSGSCCTWHCGNAAARLASLCRTPKWTGQVSVQRRRLPFVGLKAGIQSLQLAKNLEFLTWPS